MHGFSKDSLLSRVASSTSDGAANATLTSKLVGEAKQRAIDGMLAAFDADSPEVAAICTEYHVLHCSNHALNLLAGHSHSAEEATHHTFVRALAQFMRLQRMYRRCVCPPSIVFSASLLSPCVPVPIPTILFSASPLSPCVPVPFLSFPPSPLAKVEHKRGTTAIPGTRP